MLSLLQPPEPGKCYRHRDICCRVGLRIGHSESSLVYHTWQCNQGLGPNSALFLSSNSNTTQTSMPTAKLQTQRNENESLGEPSPSAIQGTPAHCKFLS